jgi:YggT family protein
LGLIGQLVRVASLAALAYASVVALTFWLVRQRHVAPFGAWPRLIRRVADPILKPIEHRLTRAGRNPQDAPLWLLGFAVLGGLLLISFADWAMRFLYQVQMAAGSGPRGALVFLIQGVFALLIAALILRVVASWFGIGAHDRRVRPIMLLTEWLVAPIRRVVPPIGMVDLSPLVAYIVLLVLRAGLLRLVL